MPKRRTQVHLHGKKKKSRASDSSSESESSHESPRSAHDSPRVTGVIAGHVPRRTSPERGRSRSPDRGLAGLLEALTIAPKRTRVIAPAACDASPDQGLMASGVFGTRRANILSALAAPSNVRLLPPVAVMVEVVGPQPTPGETQVQFHRRLRAEAAERRRTDRKGGRRQRSKKNRRH